MALSIFAILVLTVIKGASLVESSDVFESVLHRNGYTNSYGFLKRQVRSAVIPIPRGDYKIADENAETAVARLQTLENNIINLGPHLEKDTPAYYEMLVSRSDTKALKIAKNSYVNARASQYLSSKHCEGYAENPISCAEELKRKVKKIEHIECSDSKYRRHTGLCNNVENPSWGATYTPYERFFSPVYVDGIWKENMFLRKLPNAITVGEEVINMIPSNSTANQYTLGLAGWTNIVAYDLSHTVSYRSLYKGADIVCCTDYDMKVSPRFLHPFCMPLLDEGYCINYVRSMLSTPSDQKYGSAQQMNMASHYLDGSSIYGSTSEIAEKTRLGQGGMLKDVDDYQCEDGEPCLFTGDVRPEMDPITAVIHYVLIREHNRVARGLSKLNPEWSDETLYQEARRIVIGEIQHITYQEWLPNVIGNTLNPQNYDGHIHPGVYNSFANVASYFVQSLLPNNINLYGEDRSTEAKIPWKYAVVDPDLITNTSKFDSLIRTVSTQSCQGTNNRFTKAVEKYFFSDNYQEGLNGISMVVQRSRDHGIPTYSDFRKLFGFPCSDFEDFKSDIPATNKKVLEKLYPSASIVDLFIGGMAESLKNGAIVGPTFSKIIARQMMMTLVGDRFFYKNSNQKYPFTPDQLNEIRKSSFARLLCDNSENVTRMQPKAFKMFDNNKNNLVECTDESKIPKLNLKYWKA